MLEQSEYYHGAALVRLLEDPRCESIRKRNSLGYIINDRFFIFLKYTTKGRSPWGFTFDEEDIERCHKMSAEYDGLILGLICGGDGVCAVLWQEARELLGDNPGRIAVGRKHNSSYSVWGTSGELKKKIPVKRWPNIVFEVNIINHINEQ